jgi:hypothetical protein
MPATATATRSNRYAAPCATCTQVVPADAGALTREDGRWVTRHVGTCPAPPAAPAAAPAPVDGLDLSKVPAGRYAVPGSDTRLKVLIDQPTRGRWAGYTFVKDAAVYGQGQRYGVQRPGQAYGGGIVDALRVIAADPYAASAAYGRLTSTCGVCGRHLEDAESVARGIGPVCAGRF